MSFVVGIGVLLLGGVALSGPENTGDDFGFGLPSNEGVISPERAVPKLRPEGPRARGSAGPTDPNAAYRYGTTQRRGGEELQREQTMPVAPTDPSLGDPDSPLAAPTQSSAGTMPGFGPRRVGPSASGRPAAPHVSPWSSQRAGQQQGRGPSIAAIRSQQIADQLQADRMAPSTGVAASPARVSKPYANYTPPPAVSPYFNLYRTDNQAGTINNYYTFVKPQVDQRQANLSFGGEIRGIQSNQRLQNTAVQRLGKLNQVQGTNAPEFFQNSGAYFPAFNR